ncbi:MAG: isoprenylcysteine carboxylmethyltransferase family protein [Deltaproteobacteria bacterium]|nr:MAG: isoprenylcysteine carboxylmethyltransferase family protein [Deltaproteobacteria bacterium]
MVSPPLATRSPGDRLLSPAHGYCCAACVRADRLLSSSAQRIAVAPPSTGGDAECAVDGATSNADGFDTPRVLAFPPLLYASAFALGVTPHLMWPEPALPSAIASLIGPASLITGAALAVWANRVLRQAGTNADPSQPTTALVITGPFAFSRNPLYLARTLLYVGLALTMNMLWTLATLGPLLVVLHHGVIRREERYLEAKFGGAYRRYRTEVRRWL